MKKISLIGILIITLTGCSFSGRYHEKIRLKFKLNQNSASTPAQIMKSFYRPNASFLVDPASTSAFACVGLNVVGPGIDSTETDSGSSSASDVDWKALFNGTDYCAYRGFTSNLEINKDGAEISVDVLAGPSRVVQVIATPNGSGSCPTSETLADMEDRLGSNYVKSVFGDVYVVGQGVFDIFTDTVISINSWYSSTNPRNYNACEHGTKLGLLAAKYGYAAGSWAAPGNDWSAPIDFTGVTNFSGSQLLAMEDASSTTSVVFEDNGGPNRYARMDFAFDVSGINLSTYQYLNIEIDVVGGRRSVTVCDGTVDFGGVEVKVQATSATWSTSLLSSNSTGVVSLSQNFTESPSSLYTAFISGPSAAMFWVSARSTQASSVSTICSVLRIGEIYAYLE